MTMISVPQLPDSVTLPNRDDADSGSSDAESNVGNYLGLIRCCGRRHS